MIALFVTFVLILLSTWLYLEYRKIAKRWKYLDNIPGPKTLPIIGNAHQMGLNPYDFLQNFFKWWEEMGKDKFKARIGKEFLVFISDPKDAEVVLSSTTLLKKSNIYDLLRPWLGDGLLTSHGPKWHKHRKMITPSFHFRILNEFLDVMNQNSDKFIEQLSAKAVDSKMFDIQDMIHYFTLDVICDTAMGVNINAMENRDSDLVRAFQDMCILIQMRAFKILKRSNFLFRFAPEYKRWTQSLTTLTEFTAGVIEKRRKIVESAQNSESSNETGKDDNIKIKQAFLDTLLTATIDNKPLTFRDIFEEVSTFMFEGHDTTTSGIGFTIHLLSRHPKIQERVLEEQKSIFAGDLKKTPTFQDVQEMRYLEMVIKEAQRMYPSVPIIGREPTENFDMNGHIFPPETQIAVFIFAMGYNEKYFPDPYKFDPERFNPETNEKSNPYQYVPFSAGPRNCIGQKFAMLELKSVISKIVRNFEILPPTDDLVSVDGRECWEQSEYDPKLSAVLTLKSDNGILIRLRARNISS